MNKGLRAGGTDGTEETVFFAPQREQSDASHSSPVSCYPHLDSLPSALFLLGFGLLFDSGSNGCPANY